MSKKDVEIDRVKMHQDTPTKESQLVLDEAQSDNVFVVVTQAFCPHGHNMVGKNEVRFDGFPGITFYVEHEGIGGEVTVSPIHGDSSKQGVIFPPGTKLTLCCPVCREELPKLTNCGCEQNGTLRKLFLSPKLSEAHLIAVCDVWGCPLSRVIDSYTMFSEFLEGHIGDEDDEPQD